MDTITYKDTRLLRVETSIQKYLVSKLAKTEEDKYTLLLSELNKEASFMYKHSIFYEKLECLIFNLGLRMHKAEINILQDLFAICSNRHTLTESKLFCIKEKTIVAIAKHFKSDTSWVDSHISPRHDISLFNVLNLILEYDDYKEIVFKHCCKTTSCYKDGNRNSFHDPFSRDKNNYHLRKEDYRKLCESVWCCANDNSY